jgi:hypothetical protein
MQEGFQDLRESVGLVRAQQEYLTMMQQWAVPCADQLGFQNAHWNAVHTPRPLEAGRRARI